MKRLLCILSGMNMGGAETFLMKLYRHLDRSKYQMDFCINRFEEQFYEKEILSLGGKIFRIPCKSDNLKAFRESLFDVVKNNGYEHVLRVASNGMGFLDLKIAHDAGARVCAVRTSSAGGDLSLKAKVLNIIGRLLYGRFVNVKIAPSDLAAIHTFGRKAYLSNEVVMLRNALDLDLYRFSEDLRQSVRLRHGISKTAKVIGHVGQLRAEKNHKFLIKVFAEMNRNRNDVSLLLVGAGDQESALRKQVSDLNLKDQVVFAGVQRDVPAYLSAMDVFVMPSFYEGMPNAAIEAQANGLPCVISDAITRDANVTGMVEYLSLNNPSNVWCEAIGFALDKGRCDNRDRLQRAGYEISAATRQFEKYIFG